MNLREELGRASAALGEISDTPRLDAELLAAHAAGVTREALLLGDPDQPAGAIFQDLVARRLAGEPLAYITGVRDFWTISLQVAPGVLIPRPDSETLLEAAVARFGETGPASVLDLGTGSGALLLAALDQWPAAWGCGVDRSPAAVKIARANADRLGLSARAQILLGDWTEDIDRRFDLILCNPPYIATGEPLPIDVIGHEPELALFAGDDGLQAYRQLAPQLAHVFMPDGLALFEIGSGQGRQVIDIFRAAGHDPRIIADLGGRDRCVAINGSATPVA